MAQRVFLAYDDHGSGSTGSTPRPSAQGPAPQPSSEPTTPEPPMMAAARRNGRLWSTSLRDLLTPAHLPPHAVLGLTAVDPRELPLPGSTLGEEGEREGPKEAAQKRVALRKLLTKAWPAHAAQSPLWLKEVGWQTASRPA